MFYIGVDLGKKHDHTAIAIVEKDWRYDRYVDVRGLERVPLGTPYTKVVERIWEIVNERDVRGQVCVTVDGTGVGGPVIDMLNRSNLGCEISEVIITGGERAHRVEGTCMERWNVPKRDLISEVQILLEKGTLRIAKRMKEAGTLVKELIDVRATTNETGRVRLGADGAGQHDDLVIAVALACWRAKRAPIGWGAGRLPGC
jgi:hypothetical protein